MEALDTCVALYTGHVGIPKPLKPDTGGGVLGTHHCTLLVVRGSSGGGIGPGLGERMLQLWCAFPSMATPSVGTQLLPSYLDHAIRCAG